MRQNTFFSILACTFAAHIFVGCCGSSGQVEGPPPNPIETYRVGEGDILRVAVWGNGDLTGNVQVRPDGLITLQLIGEVRASGRTPGEIQQDVRQRLVRFIPDPNVTITVAEVNSYRVYVLGQVNQAGEFTPETPVTVLQAIALAGGINEFAKADSILIVRPEETGHRSIPFDYDAVVKCGRVDLNIPLITGDTVVVP